MARGEIIMDNNGNGFIVLHRKMQKTSFYHDSRAVHLAIHLLLNATHKDRKVIDIGQREVVLLRGQVLGGFKRLDRELGWKKIHVRRAFYTLRDSGFCEHYCTNKYAIITIVNYNQYQDLGVTTSPTRGVQNDLECSNVPHQGGTESILECSNVTPYNNVIYNNKNNIDHFEDLWSQYPKKVGKKKAQGYFNSSVKDQKGWDDIKAALTNYMNSKRVVDGKYIQDGKTWFYNWQDWITDPDSYSDPALDKMRELIKK
jgi:hypothetical protein